MQHNIITCYGTMLKYMPIIFKYCIKNYTYFLKWTKKMTTSDVISIVSVVINAILVIAGWFINQNTKKINMNLSHIDNKKNFSGSKIKQRNQSGNNSIG